MSDRSVRAAVVPVTVCILLLEFVANAWVSEDAHITFRAIDNFVNGYGLRWNIDERVQVYTHPLWMMLVTLAYALTREFYFTTTFLTILLSLLAYLFVARLFRDRPLLVAFALFTPIAMSKTLVRYSTSGFENALTLFLLGVFVSIWLRDRREIPVAKLALVAALAAVNRLDAILLFAPALATILLTQRSYRTVLQLAIGFVPLFGWTLFSVFYYGFPIPNTALAKLSAAVPRGVYLTKGVDYFADLVANDPVSGLMLVLGIITAAGMLIRLPSRRSDAGFVRLAALGCGILLYSGYVVWIGGDFLTGRFWTAPIFGSIVLCAAQLDRARAREWFRDWRLAALAVVALASFAATGSLLAARVAQRIPGHPIPLSLAHLSLTRNLTWERSREATLFTMVGWQMRKLGESDPGVVVERDVIGIAGMAAGRNVTIVDTNALADPLLARLPPMSSTQFKIGHLERAVPDGYKEARRTGSVEGMHPALGEYYSKLRLIVSGPLFDRERVDTIVRFNLGMYDALRDRYVESEERP